MRNDELYNTKSKIIRRLNNFKYVRCPENISLRSKNNMCIDFTISILRHTEFLNSNLCIRVFVHSYNFGFVFFVSLSSLS